MIEVIKVNRPKYDLRAEQMESGRAYECEHGDIYICNPYEDIIAFSVCGSLIVLRDVVTRYREVDMTIQVS